MSMNQALVSVAALALLLCALISTSACRSQAPTSNDADDAGTEAALASYQVGSELLLEYEACETRELVLTGLTPGNIVHFSVDAQDSRNDLILSVDGKEVRGSLLEGLVWLVEPARDVRLRIACDTAGALPSFYRLTSRTRSPTPSDLAELEARRLFKAGNDAKAAAGEQLPRALELYTESEATFRECGNASGQALAITMQGSIYDLLGNPTKAREQFLRAKEIAPKASGWWRARLATGLANALWDIGELENAEANYLEALALTEKVGNITNQATLLHSLGELYESLGRFNDAYERKKKAHQLFLTTKNEHFTALEVMGLGTLAGKLGDAADARTKLEHAVSELDRMNLIWDGGMARIALGQAYANNPNDAELARKTLIRGLEQSKEAGNVLGASTALIAIASLLRQEGKYDEAMERLREGEKLLAPFGWEFQKAIYRYELGKTLEAQGRYRAANRHYTFALERAIAIEERRLASKVRAGLARVQAQLGNHAQALALNGLAIEAAESSRSTLRRAHHRAVRSSEVTAAYRQRVALLMAAGRATEAFAASEKSRALSYREVHPAVCPGDDAARALERETRLEALEHSHRVLRAQPNVTQGRLRASEAELADALRDVADACGSIDMAPLPSLEEIQERLPESALLLEFSSTKVATYVWAIERDKIRSFTIARDDIGALAWRSFVAMRDSAKRSTVEAGDAQLALSRALLRKALASSDATQLFIVPDHALTMVPFAALPNPSSPERALVEDYTLRILPAASLLRSPGAPPVRRSVAILADPVFSSNDSRLQVKVEGSGQDLPRLHFSRKEAEAIAKIAEESELYLDFSARAEVLRSERKTQVDVLHLATHGVANVRYPELSHLALSMVQVDGSPDRGTLRLHEIATLAISAPLVVLSACETNAGAFMHGEGLISLTRGFLMAGAREVLATRWQVHDLATAEFMTHFYTALLSRGASAAEALREAQLALRSDPRWSAPYYWAAFVLHGS